MRSKPAFASYFLILLCSVPRYAQCQAIDGVYRGTLGRQEIVVEIGVDPEQADGAHLIGRYFYRRHGVGISLKGARAQDGSYLLAEYHSWKNTGGQWKLKFQKDQAMGFFCKCDLEHGATRTEQLPIQLNRGSSGFNPSFDPFYADEETSSAAEDQPYYDLLLDFPLTTGPEVVTADGYAYVMLQDSRFRVSMPKITKFPDHAGMMKVNQLLAKELAQYRLQAAGCAQGIDFNGGDFDLSTGVELFSRHLLSVVRHGSSFCGGAHPNFQLFINLYDLHTGTEVSTDDLLAREIDPDTVKKLIGNTSADGADLIRGLIAELYLQHAHPEADCLDVITRDENRAPVFSTKHYLSGHGLVVVPDLPHVEQACAEDVTISYDELRPLLRKNSQLFMLAGINQ